MTDQKTPPTAGALTPVSTRPAAPVRPAAAGRPAAPEPPAAPERRAAPERPTVARPSTAPVLIKATPPFTVRASEFFWILAFAMALFNIVYLFIIRKDLLPLISKAAEKIDKSRSTETYSTAADIVFWTVFGLLVAVLLLQITMLVSFMSRKPHVRWWQLVSLLLLLLATGISSSIIALGPQGKILEPLLLGQCALVLLALFFSILPPAMKWSARRHDIRRGPEQPAGGDF